MKVQLLTAKSRTRLSDRACTHSPKSRPDHRAPCSPTVNSLNCMSDPASLMVTPKLPLKPGLVSCLHSCPQSLKR